MLVRTTVSAIVNGFGGALLLALAVWVLAMRPRRAMTILLGVFAATFGLWTLSLYTLDHAHAAAPALDAVGVAAIVASGLALPALALRWPRPLRAEERRLLALPALVLVGCFALNEWMGAAQWETLGLALGYPEARLPLFRALTHGFALFFATLPATLVFLALRHAATHEPRVKQQLRLFAAALSIYTGLAGGLEVLTFEHPLIQALGISMGLGLAASALVWLASTRGSDGAGARDLALLSLGAYLAGMLIAVWTGGYTGAVQGGFLGVFRTLAVAILTFAILRHQILGLDVKIKWTLQRGTLTAMFVGVFFAAAEVAQNFLSDEFGLLAGGVTAGLLLFALHPLQRMADRVADAAMPGVQPVAAMVPDERVRLYREAAEGAWADGTLTRDERALLDRMRASLGLDLEEASRIERDAADATGR